MRSSSSVPAAARAHASCAVYAAGAAVLPLAPTRLTRAQLADNPSLDVVHSKSLGGAELKGEVLDAQQHMLTSA